jgi:hypothetical protein
MFFHPRPKFDFSDEAGRSFYTTCAGILKRPHGSQITNLLLYAKVNPQAAEMFHEIDRPEIFATKEECATIRAAFPELEFTEGPLFPFPNSPKYGLFYNDGIMPYDSYIRLVKFVGERTNAAH